MTSPLREALAELVALYVDGEEAWASRDLRACRCDHNEYCGHCWPMEFRQGGKYYDRAARKPLAWASARAALASQAEEAQRRDNHDEDTKASLRRKVRNQQRHILDLQARRVPHGYKLVPLEPTQTMLEAADVDVSASCESGLDEYRAIYRAMLEASPDVSTPPAGAQEAPAVQLAAALGWPGGISEPVLDWDTLLREVARLRIAQAPAGQEARPAKSQYDECMQGCDDPGPAAVQGEWRFDLDEVDAELLKHTIGSDDCSSPVTLALMDGTEGRGLYVWLTEYPDEGSILLASAPPSPPQAAQQAEAAPTGELFAIANELHGAFDEQTYDEKRKADWGLPDEHEFIVTITAKQERALSEAIIAAEKAAPAQPSAAAGEAQDAARYRWLRQQHWDEAEISCVVNPKAAVKLGYDCPSFERLDAAIDAAIAQRNGGEKP